MNAIVRKGKKGKAKGEDESSSSTYRATASFYRTPPTDEVTLTDFETLAQDRLQVLTTMEKFKLANTDRDLQSAEYQKMLIKHNIFKTKNDHTSHFILRLAYCRSEDLRRWFLRQEENLFRYRFEGSDVESFLQQNGFDYEQLDMREASESIKHSLETLNNGRSVMGDKYFKVPFTEALDLVKNRRCHLEQGFAYVSSRNLVSIVSAKFRAHLSQELVMTFKQTSHLRTDKRLSGLLKGMALQSNNSQYQPHRYEGSVRKEDIPKLSQQSFALCMSNLQQGLSKDNHLKHGGRMQYGLFLKGIGLGLNDALDFWRQSFSRRTPPDKFNKQYAYNVRHNYGKEGKRTDYTPYGCVKIIHSQPTSGDHHGCPFRHFDETKLAHTLREKGIKHVEAQEILDRVKNMHYQVACQMYFAATHEGYRADEVGNHPNAYFDASIAYYQKKEKKDEPAVPAQPTTTIRTTGEGSDVASETAVAASS